MSLIEKDTWCPRCHQPTIIREERTVLAGGMWPKMFIIIYRCTGILFVRGSATVYCNHEVLIPVKLSKKQKRILRHRQDKAMGELVKETEELGGYDIPLSPYERNE